MSQFSFLFYTYCIMGVQLLISKLQTNKGQEAVLVIPNFFHEQQRCPWSFILVLSLSQLYEVPLRSRPLLSNCCWNNHSWQICKDINVMLHHQGKSNFVTIALQCQQRQKKERENAIPLGTILLCCSLKLHSLKCLAAELVDSEVPRDACEANKFNCQPGAASLCRRHNEPGENVKQGKMKQTLWSISCSNSWISNTSSELKWKTWLTSGAEQFSREEMEYQFGGVFSGIFTKHTSEIFNLADQQMPFPSLDWIILYGNTIIRRIITCSLGDLGYSSFLLLTTTGALPREQPRELISDNPWFTSSIPPTILWHSRKST